MLTVALDFVSNDPASGNITLPEGLVVGHAYTTIVPSAQLWTFQARTYPGAVALTDGGSFQDARIIGQDLTDWFFYRWLWLWTVPPDVVACANAQVEFRAGANDGNGWAYSAWSAPLTFSGGAMGGAGAHDPMLDTILACVRTTF